MSTPRERLAAAAAQSQMSSFLSDYFGLVSVKSFKAKGDGIQNDTQYILAAKAFADEYGFKALYFPHGTYLVDSDLADALTGYFLWGDDSSFIGISKTINQVGDFASATELNALKADYENFKAITVNASDFVLPSDNGDYGLAVNRAIEFANPNMDSSPTSAIGRIVYIPDNEEHIVKTPIVLKSGCSLVGSGRGSVLKKGDGLDTDKGIIYVTGGFNWSIKNLTLEGVDCTVDGIHADNSDMDNVRWSIENVRAYRCKIGCYVYGYIGYIDKTCTFNWNQDGAELIKANAVRCDATIEQNTRKGLTIIEAAAITIGGGCVIEGHTGGAALTIEDSHNVTIDNVYFENTSDYPDIEIGTTDLCRFIEIRNVLFASTSTPQIKLDKVENVIIQNIKTYTYFNPFNFTENTKNVQLINVENLNGFLTENDDEVVLHSLPMNVFPNSRFDRWSGSTILGIKTYTGNAGLVSISKETSIVRNGENSMKIAVATNSDFPYRGIQLKSWLVDYLKGDYISVGAWVYVPDIEDFEEGQAGPAMGIANTTYYTPSNKFAKGKWNFMHVTGLISAEATDIEIRFYVKNAAGGNTNMYIVVDELIICKGIIDPGSMATKIIPYAINSNLNFTVNDIEFEKGVGPILTSPNGTRYRITVSDLGDLSADAVT